MYACMYSRTYEDAHIQVIIQIYVHIQVYIEYICINRRMEPNTFPAIVLQYYPTGKRCIGRPKLNEATNFIMNEGNRSNILNRKR
jgi:hypothetical protein